MHKNKFILLLINLFFLIFLVFPPIKPVKALSCANFGPKIGYLYYKNNNLEEGFYIRYEKTGNGCMDYPTVVNLDDDSKSKINNKISFEYDTLNGSYIFEVKDSLELGCHDLVYNNQCIENLTFTKLSDSNSEFQSQKKKAESNEIQSISQARNGERQGVIIIISIIFILIISPLIGILLLRKFHYIYTLGLIFGMGLIKFLILNSTQFYFFWSYLSWRNLNSIAWKLLPITFFIEIIFFLILRKLWPKHSN